MKRIALTAVGFLASIGFAFSQIASDAIRYSQLDLGGGTARTVAVGGAMGALGADFSTVSTNPAGLGAFRSDELIFSPAFRVALTRSTLKSDASSPTSTESKSNFNVSNFGLVFNNNYRRDTARAGWRSANFAIGVNKLANFNSRGFYEGQSKGSLTDAFLEEARSVGNDTSALYPLGARLAAQTYALYFQGTDTLKTDFEDYPDALVSRYQDTRTSGGVNEMTISMGGNFDDRLFLGATVGVPFYSYTEQKTYVETDPNEEVEYFDGLQFDEFLSTSGVGVNLKLGAIYRMSQNVRLGAAFHTPTVAGLTDNFNSTFNYRYTDASGPNENEAAGAAEPFAYRVTTPWRAIFSGAFLVNRRGFVSADVEIVDHSRSKFDLTKNVNTPENRDYERDLNTQVASDFQQTVNIRLGAEALMDRHRFRGGLQLLGTPFLGAEKERLAPRFSLGWGYRGDHAYIDLAWRHQTASANFQPYAVAFHPKQSVSAKQSTSDVVMTVGFKF